MRRPSKGILIRLAIYGPLLGYLAWRAFAPHPAEAPAESPAPTSRKITTEDGKSFEVIEVTPEQAEKMLGHPLPAHGDADPPPAGADRASPPSDAPGAPSPDSPPAD